MREKEEGSLEEVARMLALAEEALVEVSREASALRAELGSVKANRPVEPGANPRFYQAYVDETHRILDPGWAWRGLSVSGAAERVTDENEQLRAALGPLLASMSELFAQGRLCGYLSLKREYDDACSAFRYHERNETRELR